MALRPSTGGTFVVVVRHRLRRAPAGAVVGSEATADDGVHDDDDETEAEAEAATVLWDRRIDGGFPETKELKRRLRDVIDPGRSLGHVDGPGPAAELRPDAPPPGAREPASAPRDVQAADDCEHCAP